MADRPGAVRGWSALVDDIVRASGGRGNPLRGRVVDELDLAPGRLRGRVRAARERDAQVEVTWGIASDAAWTAAGRRLAERARGFVALLDGAMDAFLVDELAAVGVAVVPPRRAIAVRCDRDGEAWCVHARALLQAALGRIVRDPGLVLLLAGCSREVLLARVRTLLGVEEGDGLRGPEREAGDGSPVDPSTLVVRPAPPSDVTAVLERLGPPPGFDDTEALADVVRSAAAFAWAIAAGEGEVEADRQLLLATLRTGGSMTAAELAATLGASEPELERELERLHAQGAALRTGPAGLHRYRAR